MNLIVMNFFASNIKFLIKKYATSQDRLASYVGKTQTSVSNWINEISEPDISVLIKTAQFFGLSLDAVVFTDLQNSNLITDEHVELFKHNSNLIGNPNGNPIGKLPPVNENYYIDQEGLKSEVNEPSLVGEYYILSQLKKMDEKLDGLRLLAETILKNKPK